MAGSAGYVKVLDFGLAKLRAPGGEGTDEQANLSRTAVKGTDPGTVMGTAGYMAPEQARGEAVDSRADLFSAGCILYELVSGQRAFHGDSSVDTLHKILYNDPQPIRSLRDDIPADLARIVRKALAKDPEERYQTAKDLAIDLRELLREIDSSPGAADAPVPARRTARRLWPALIVLILAGAAAAIVLQSRDRAAAGAAERQPRISRLTASGKVIGAAISPDGKFIAYTISDQGEQSLWVRQMASGQSLELIPPQRTAYWGMAFSPAGDIYYGMKHEPEPGGAIYQISPLGGTPRRIVAGIDSPPTFSPDGKRIAFLRARHPTADESALMVANIDGSDATPLTTVRAPDLFVPIFYASAAWSPDGTQIAAPLVNRDRQNGKIVGVDIASGSMKTIAEHGWSQVAHLAWLPDGEGLIAIAQRGDELRTQVWYVPYPKGTPVPITNDLFDYRMASLTADGRALATVAADAAADLWLVPDGAEPKRITAAKLEGSFGVTVLPGGRMVFTSLETGKVDLWVMNGDGSGRMLLTRDQHENRWPRVTPDGKSIVYLSVTSAGNELCRMNVDGSGRRVLASGLMPSSAPAISPDGKWVAYHAPRGNVIFVFRVPVDGGPPVEVAASSHTPAYSPDGSRIAVYTTEGDGRFYGLGIVAAAGGSFQRKIAFSPPFFSSQIRWTDDGQALVVNTAPSDRANLWQVPLDGSPPRRLTSFDEHVIVAFDALPGGGWVASRGDLSRDAMLITDFR